MAFIRRKRVRGNSYYQVVRNYRDGDGNHRQEVLCHLGVYGSLEAAIAVEQTKVRINRERAFLRRIKANALKTKLQNLYGWEFVNGAIPSEAEAARELDHWWLEREGFFTSDDIYSGTELMELEEINIQVEKYMSCIEYHAALRRASWADERAAAHQEKLEKLLLVQREYF